MVFRNSFQGSIGLPSRLGFSTFKTISSKNLKVGIDSRIVIGDESNIDHTSAPEFCPIRYLQKQNPQEVAKDRRLCCRAGQPMEDEAKVDCWAEGTVSRSSSLYILR